MPRLVEELSEWKSASLCNKNIGLQGGGAALKYLF